MPKIVRHNSTQPSAPTSSKKPWYLRGWGIALLILAALFLGLILAFGFRVYTYVQAINNGNFDAFGNDFIDLSGYAPGEYVSRTEVETFDDPGFGPDDAKVVVVEFGDFGCPFCKKNYPTINRIHQEYSDRVRFVYRDFPVLYLHPQAGIAAQAAECADDQGLFWPYHDLLYERQGMYEGTEDLITFASTLNMNTETFRECLEGEKYKNEVAQDLQEGIRFNIQGTPTFFINGQKISGVLTYSAFKQILDQKLQTAN